MSTSLLRPGWRPGAAALAAALLSAVVVGATPAHAIPTDGDPVPDCIANTTAAMTVSATLVDSGSPVTVTWNTQAPAGCTIPTVKLETRLEGGSGGIQPIGTPQGSMVFHPTGRTSWILHAVWGQVQLVPIGATPVVEVRLPTVNGRPAVTIERDDQVALFLQAISTPNTTVRIGANVNLNVSNLNNLFIAPGVQISGGRTSRVPGARIFTTGFPGRLFLVGGNGNADNVRISGIRLEGAEMGIADEEAWTSTAITVISSVNVEIDNNEISGWRGSGVDVRDPDHRINLGNASAVRVHDNYIHHNRHYRENGYGVSLHDSAYALIEQNYFDYNRHAIAGQGVDGTGYLAYANLFGPNGGENASHLGITFNTHMIDMHGTEDCWGFAKYCGQAGEYLDIRDNTILYDAGSGIKVRGAPTVRADVRHNIFATTDQSGGYLDDAGIVQTQGDNVLPADNVYGYEFGGDGMPSCDFDGDGRGDTFVATGATWWYSPSGVRPWRYLNTSSTKLTGLEFGDLDSDGRCDVRAGGITYSGGRTPSAPARTNLLWVNQATGAGKFWELSGAGAVQHEAVGTYVDTEYPQILGTGDFNADGAADLVWRGPEGKVYVQPLGANGSFVSPLGSRSRVQGIAPMTSQLAGIGDFNADRRADLLWRDSAGVLEIWFGGESGNAAKLGINNTPAPIEPSARVRGIGDFNADGYSDILFVRDDGRLTTWIMRGNVRLGTIYTADATAGTTQWTVQAVADFDGDRYSDILWRDNTGALLIWSRGAYQAGVAVPSWQNQPGGLTRLDQQIKAAGDVNADGRADIIWRDAAGAAIIWLMDGGHYLGQSPALPMDPEFKLAGPLPVAA